MTDGPVQRKTANDDAALPLVLGATERFSALTDGGKQGLNSMSAYGLKIKELQ